jgi:hypothetical protein
MSLLFYFAVTHYLPAQLSRLGSRAKFYIYGSEIEI